MLKHLTFLLLIAAGTVSAQSLQSTYHLTPIPDTSFSIAKDHQNNLKKYPFIKRVPDSSTAAVTEHRNMVYCTIGDRQLHVDAFTSSARKGKPIAAVIIIHGGGWRSGNHTQHIPLAQHLAALGIASFTVEYRLSTEAFFPLAIWDVKSAIKWMRANASRYHIDPNKIAVLGFSAGGQLAALTGLTPGMKRFDGNNDKLHQSARVQAVIDIDGTLSFVHPESSETQNPAGVGASAWWIGYPRTERLDVWTEASPLTYAKKNKLPFLFLNSAVDRMHAGRDDFKKLMDSAGVYTKIVSFPNTPHTFCLYRPWFDDVVSNIHVFMDRVFGK